MGHGRCASPLKERDTRMYVADLLLITYADPKRDPDARKMLRLTFALVLVWMVLFAILGEQTHGIWSTTAFIAVGVGAVYGLISLAVWLLVMAVFGSFSGFPRHRRN